MGYIVLAFYGCDYVQNLVSVKGAANPFMFVVLLVGVQGVADFWCLRHSGRHRSPCRGKVPEVKARLAPCQGGASVFRIEKMNAPPATAGGVFVGNGSNIPSWKMQCRSV